MGWSDDWQQYTLCEFMQSHFRLYGCQPALLCNVMDPAKMSKEAPPNDYAVDNGAAMLPAEAIDDARLQVYQAGGAGLPLEKGRDYDTIRTDAGLAVEVAAGGAAQNASSLHIRYYAADASLVTPANVAAGIESVELSLAETGMMPDLMLAPGYSGSPDIAAALTLKARGISGMFRAKALVDIPADKSTAQSYEDAIKHKSANSLQDSAMVLCWPMVSLGGRRYHLSTQLAGLMARTDTANDGCPYQSPSNQRLPCDSSVLADGSEASLTFAHARALDSAGIVTALRFINGWTAYGNYTSAWPATRDVKDAFVPVSRMFGWVGNTILRTFWSLLDHPMNRRLVDSIMDTCSIWLNGLVGAGYLLGARALFLEAENPAADLMAGILRVHLYLTPPSPAQQIDFVLEYDANYVRSAFAA
jgi:phage tail sheath protein FI